MTLINQDACDPSVAQAMQNLQSNGTEQYEKYKREVLERGTKSMHDPIPKNNYPLISTPLKRTGLGNKTKIIKDNGELFGKMVAVLQSREISLQNFFCYEMHSYPPAISNRGSLNLPGNKAGLVHELVSSCHTVPDALQQYTPGTAFIMDGGRIPYQHPPKPNAPFKQYADALFQMLGFLFLLYQRIDLVFDIYLPNSLKATTRDSRGKGIRRRVFDEGKCPSNWSMFLREDENKNELNIYLAENLSAKTFPEERFFFVTSQEKVLTNSTASMNECNHEEADTRLVIHIKHGLSEGMNNFVVSSCDTDVIVILLGVYHQLRSAHDFSDIVVDFGIKKDNKRISIKNLACSLGQTRCQALIFFHSFTGADCNSAFKGVGKKKAYAVLDSYPEVENVFAGFHTDPFQNLDEDDGKFNTIQRFVVLLYSRTSLLHSVNEARMELYYARSQNHENIPPTKNALLFHTKRAIYQSGVWSQSLEEQQNLPSPKNFGWKESEGVVKIWEPLWMTLQEASKEIRELRVKCGCKATPPCTSTARCICKSAGFRCSLLCSCKCTNKISYP